jgi:hypothetical protein
LNKIYEERGEVWALSFATTTLFDCAESCSTEKKDEELPLTYHTLMCNVWRNVVVHMHRDPCGEGGA